MVVALLTQNRVVGTKLGEPGSQVTLCREVHCGDDVDVAALGGRDRQRMAPSFDGHLARLAGEHPGNVDEVLRSVGHGSIVPHPRTPFARLSRDTWAWHRPTRATPWHSG